MEDMNKRSHYYLKVYNHLDYYHQGLCKNNIKIEKIIANHAAADFYYLI